MRSIKKEINFRTQIVARATGDRQGQSRNNLLFQALEDLNHYTSCHITDAEFPLLREKLRFLHKLTKGITKTKIRGCLGYMTRWSKMRTWLRIAQVIKDIFEEESFITLESENILQFHRFVKAKDVIKAASENSTKFLKSEL